MKTFLSGLLIIGLMLALLPSPGCARIVQKEFEIVEGKSLLSRETEYNRFGDQTLTGLEAERTEPNGVSIKIALETQKSEGKLQIEGLVSAIGEVVSAWMGVDGLTPEQIQQLKDILAASQ